MRLCALGLGLALGGCSGAGEPSPSSSSSAGPTVSPSSGTGSALGTSSAPSTTNQPLRGVVVLLDPGHNGGNSAHPATVNRLVDAGFGKRKPCNTTGTETNSGYPEHAQVWDVAQRLTKLLRSQGARVELTRDSDTGVGPCIDVRGRAGRAVKADLALSLHADGSLSRSARGFHVAFAGRMAGGAPAVSASKKLAVAVRDAFARGTEMPRASYLGGGSGLSERADLATLNLSSVPTVLLESGNMRHPADSRLLSDPEFRQREALALADGVRRFVGR